MSFLHRGFDFIYGVVVGEFVGDELDHVYAVIDVLPYCRADFFGTVSLEVLELPELALLWRNATVLAAVGRDDLSRRQDRGADKPAFVDGTLQIYGGVIGFVSDVAYRRDACV